MDRLNRLARDLELAAARRATPADLVEADAFDALMPDAFDGELWEALSLPARGLLRQRGRDVRSVRLP